MFGLVVMATMAINYYVVTREYRSNHVNPEDRLRDDVKSDRDSISRWSVFEPFLTRNLRKEGTLRRHHSPRKQPHTK